MSDSKAIRYLTARVQVGGQIFHQGRPDVWFLHFCPTTFSPSWWTFSWRRGSGQPWGAQAGLKPGVGAVPAGWPAGPWPAAAGGWRSGWRCCRGCRRSGDSRAHAAG